MGTINYKTSDYITLGVLTNEYSEEDIEFLYTEAQDILDNYNFYYIHVVICPGYYEGFSIDIELNYPVYYDDTTEKKEALKEVTALKKCLFELANVGLCACTPGWCTGYADYKRTIADIKNATKEIKNDICATPTWRTYAKAETA
jgi:hypothetical protein